MTKEDIKLHLKNVSVIIGLIVLLFGGSLLVGNFVKSNPVSLKIDGYFYNLIANGPHNQFLDVLVWPINNNFLHVGGTNMPSYFLVMLGLFFVYLAVFKRKVLGWALVTYFIASLLIGSIYVFDSHFIFRSRPYDSLPNTLSEQFKSALRGWNSYPSGHARDTAVYSVIISHYLPGLTIPTLIFSLFVGWSRVYVGAHYPTDALVGLILGFLLGRIALLITNELKLILKQLKEMKHVQNK